MRAGEMQRRYRQRGEGHAGMEAWLDRVGPVGASGDAAAIDVDAAVFAFERHAFIAGRNAAQAVAVLVSPSRSTR